MTRRLRYVIASVVAIFLLASVALAFLVPERQIDISTISGDATRGEYVLRLGGCVACHTRAKGGTFLAGGDAIETPFGSFIAPNITSDPKHGLGAWSAQDFANALINGRAPDGSHYYPVFPYTSYSYLSGQDIADLWAYLKTVSPVAEDAGSHDIRPALLIRPVMAVWKALHFRPRAFEPDPGRSEAWSRGAYLVTGPGHCGECHTPRDRLGRMDRSQRFAGAKLPPKGEKVPGLTREALDKAGWSHDDLVLGFKFGIMPDGDVLGGSMGEVIDGSLGHLRDEDLQAIAIYLLAE